MLDRRWTWVHALHKAMVLRMGAPVFTLSIHDMVALFHIQEGKCAISGRPFYIPIGLDKGITWSTYVNMLNPESRVDTPALVRVDDEGFWLPNNVFYVTLGWELLYLGFGYLGLKKESQLMLNNKLVIPMFNRSIDQEEEYV